MMATWRAPTRHRGVEGWGSRRARAGAVSQHVLVLHACQSSWCCCCCMMCRARDKGFRTAALIRFVGAEDGLLSQTGDGARMFINIEGAFFVPPASGLHAVRGCRAGLAVLSCPSACDAVSMCVCHASTNRLRVLQLQPDHQPGVQARHGGADRRPRLHLQVRRAARARACVYAACVCVRLSRGWSIALAQPATHARSPSLSAACGPDARRGPPRLHWGKAGFPDRGCWHGDVMYGENWCNFGCALRALDPTGKFLDSAPAIWTWAGMDLDACCGPDGFTSKAPGCQCKVQHARAMSDCPPAPFYTSR